MDVSNFVTDIDYSIKTLMIAKTNLANKEAVLTESMVTNVHANLVGKAQTVKKVT